MKCISKALMKVAFPSATWEGVIKHLVLFTNNIGLLFYNFYIF